jgi:hypothetical protein
VLGLRLMPGHDHARRWIVGQTTARPAVPACIPLTGLNVQRSFRNER